jgi:hypothetical protein
VRGFATLLESFSLLLPGWLVFNSGGGGGISTVHTDGVTIQGDGSSGDPIALLDAMTDGTSLLGAGIAANKLRVAPVDYFTYASPDNFLGTGAGFIGAFGFVTTVPITFSNIVVIVAQNDPTETVALGIYNLAGDLIADTGPMNVPGGGVTVFPILGGAQTIQPGRYLFAESDDLGTFAMYGDQFAGAAYWYFNQFLTSAATPGQLDPTITVPPITPTQGSWYFGLY